MAFTTQLTAHGYTYNEAYIKAHLMHCDTQRTVVKLTAWPSQTHRDNGAEPVRYDNDLRSFATDLDLQAANPVAYAYSLLENSGEFENAIWNV